MIFQDQVTINAEASRVWDCLLDVNRVAACMPGVERVTQIDDRTFDAAITARVGPISGAFSFRAHLLESLPPKEMKAHIEGTDSVTRSTLTADVAMTLRSVETGGTQLAYHASVDVQGRLAILGDMVLRATAALMLEEFMNRLRREVENPTPIPGEGPGEAAGLL